MLAKFLSELQLYFDQGGYVMPPLVIGTIVLWFCIGYRFSLLQRGSKRSVRELIRRAQNNVLQKGKGVIDQAVLMGLQHQRQDHDVLRSYLDDSFAPFHHQIQRYSTLITSIVAVSPLLGLLGTVGGMIETFESLGSLSLYSQSGGIAGGISQALFTTQMGLAVAIPGLIVSGFLNRKQHQIEMELAQIKDMLCAKVKQ